MKPTEAYITFEHDYNVKLPRVTWASFGRPEAQAVIALLEQWGMVAATPDGEDSTGRARLRLSTPEEMVDRAIETVRLAFLKMDELDWFVRVPPPQVIEKEPR